MVPPMDEGQDPRARVGSAGALMAWAIVGLCVAAAMWVALSRPAPDASPPTGSAGLSPLELQVRAAVGAYHLSPMLAPPLLEQLDAAHADAGRRLHLAVAAGEVTGPEEARRRLDALAEETGLATDVATLDRLYREGPGAIDDRERAWLRARLGWSAELALVHGLPPTDPARAAVLAQARRTLGGLAIANLLAIGLLVGAIGSGIVLLLRWRRGRLRAAYPTPLLVAVRHPSACIEGFALYLVTYTAFSIVTPLLMPGLGLSGAWLYLPMVPLVLFATVRRGMAWKDLRQAIGWHRGRGVLREVGAGIVGWLAALPLIALALVAAQALVRHYPATHPIEQVLADADRETLLWMVALASGFAPVVEETMFRGLLFHHLRTRWAWLPAALLTSVVFAALHPQGVAALPALTTIALVMAALRAWRGSLIAPVTAHALNNGVVLVVVILLRD